MSKLSDFIGHRIPTPLAPGKVLGVLPAEGGSPIRPGWVTAGVTDFQEFTTSGVWTKPEGANFVAIHVVAAGADGNASQPGSGGQGFFAVLSASQLASSVPVVVGSRGPGSGGNSSFGAFLAKGGSTAASGIGFYYGTYGLDRPAYELVKISRGLLESASYDDWGGNSIYGGGGGTGSNVASAAGASVFAGNGGHNNTPGAFPGGGGGKNAQGANGVVRVWCW